MSTFGAKQNSLYFNVCDLKRRCRTVLSPKCWGNFEGWRSLCYEFTVDVKALKLPSKGFAAKPDRLQWGGEYDASFACRFVKDFTVQWFR